MILRNQLQIKPLVSKLNPHEIKNSSNFFGLIPLFRYFVQGVLMRISNFHVYGYFPGSSLAKSFDFTICVDTHGSRREASNEARG